MSNRSWFQPCSFHLDWIGRFTVPPSYSTPQKSGDASGAGSPAVCPGPPPSPGAITLAVGDGADDGPMIQAAHVGVSVAGRDGAGEPSGCGDMGAIFIRVRIVT